MFLPFLPFPNLGREQILSQPLEEPPPGGFVLQALDEGDEVGLGALERHDSQRGGQWTERSGKARKDLQESNHFIH